MSKDKFETSCLTIGNTIYRTGGNILFADEKEGSYFVAESTVLEKMDRAIQEGILVCGMNSFVAKVSAVK